MLMMPESQRVLYKLGLASLGATQDELERLAAAYWFTFEVGLCQESGQRKILGGAVLSSVEESAIAMSPKAKVIDFDLDKITTEHRHSIQYSGIQPFYVLSPEIPELYSQLDQWLDGFLERKAFVPSFCEETRTIKVTPK